MNEKQLEARIIKLQDDVGWLRMQHKLTLDTVTRIALNQQRIIEGLRVFFGSDYEKIFGDLK